MYQAHTLDTSFFDQVIREDIFHYISAVCLPNL